MKNVFRYLALYFLVCCGASFARQAQCIRVGIFPFEPLNYFNDDDVASGLNPDLLRAIVEDQDEWDVSFVPVNWAEGLRQLQNEEIDLMVSVAYTPERAQTMDYNHSPVLEVWGQVFIPAGTAMAHVSELNEKRIGIMRADVSGENFIDLTHQFSVSCEIIPYPTHNDVFEAIQSGEVDAGVAPNHFGIRHAEEHQLIGSSVQFSPFSLFFASKKGLQQEFLSEIDFHLGRWKQVKKFYYYNRFDYWLNGKRGWAENVPLWLWIVTGFISGLGVLLFATNRVLKFRVHYRTRELQELTIRQNTLLASNPDIVVEIDCNKKFVWTNQAGYDFFGPDIIGKESSFYFEGEQDIDNQMAPLFNGLGDQQTLYVESWQRRIDGEKRLLAWWCRTLIDENGCTTGALSTARDITEHEKMSKALEQSERNFRTLVETLPVAIYLSSEIDQICEYMNPTFTDLFGYTIEDVPSVAEWYPMAYPDADYRSRLVDEWTEKVQRAIDTQSRIEPIEAVVTCKNGSTKNILWGFTATDEKNYAYGLDLTDRKQAEEALRVNDELLRQMSSMAKIGGWEFDPETGQGSWTDEVARIYDLDPEDGTSVDLAIDVFRGESRRKIEAAIKNAVELGQSYDLDLELETPKGKHKWVRTVGYPVMQGDRVVKVQGALQDITVRKKAEMTMNEQLDELHRYHAVLMGREDRVIEIKREVNELLARLHEPPHYPSALETDQ